MKFRLLMTTVVFIACLPFYAAQAHEPHHFSFGSPAKAAAVTKTIHVRATDQMRLIFDSEDIRVGDVVAFVVTNTGAIPHEFGVADEAGQREHAQEMMRMPTMAHVDPNVISLKPGETRTLVWSFKNLGQRQLVFACNVPGHYSAGMFVRVTVK